ncbi:MAG: DeoR family transcriptional regulator, partial [Mediterranea sp.]|jgi:ATP-dependent DNA helicase RecG|nr:DeoR family transcriptional regulator [Mediterranea sp.]
VEEVDGKNVLAIWVPAGTNRPYDVKESVAAKQSVSKWYIRSGTSSIEAKGEVLDELREMASRVPFDDRGNPDIKISDLDPLLVQDYLKRVNSKLLKDFRTKSFEEILDQMDLFVGPTERRMIKNVAAMMFCENPAKFFPTTQVDIVIFPEGLEKNPNNMIEVPKIVGPVPYMIKATLDYLHTVVVKERIIKPKDRAESIRFFNYPYQAFEEAVVNALYHRDYQEREPVEITVEPNIVSILSYTGPDRSISMAAIKEAKKLKARRYRNRRLGDFLKELELSEGRATGIPTIQDELHRNGSPDASIETDDDRSYFLIEIPCREGFEGLNVPNGPINVPNDPKNDTENDPINDPNDTENDTKNDTEKRLITNRQKLILSLIKSEATISNSAMAERLSVSIITIKRDMNKLTELGLIRHIGPAKGGRWEIIANKRDM